MGKVGMLCLPWHEPAANSVLESRRDSKRLRETVLMRDFFACDISQVTIVLEMEYLITTKGWKGLYGFPMGIDNNGMSCEECLRARESTRMNS